jgi:hypothetical protein
MPELKDTRPTVAITCGWDSCREAVHPNMIPRWIVLGKLNAFLVICPHIERSYVEALGSVEVPLINRR